MRATCSQTEQRELYLSGGLEGDVRAAFVAHAAGCEACAHEMAQWRSFGSVLTGQLAPMRRAPTRAEVAELVARAEEPKSQIPRWVMPAVAVAAFALIAVVVTVTRAPTEAQWAAQVVASNELTSGADGYSTKATGHALLKLGEDDLGLGPATAVSIAKATSAGTVIRLGAGSLAAHVNPARGKRNFDIETSLGNVHVVGTVFRVRSTAEQLQVDVIRGVVEVRSVAGVLTRVPAGHALRLKRGVAEAEESGFDATEYSELSPEGAPVEVPGVVDAGVEEADAGVAVAAVEPTPVKRVAAPVAAWRTAAAKGDCASVVVAAEKYVQRDATDADVWLLLGDCRRRQRAYDAAVTAYVAASKTREAQGKNGLLQAAELLQQELHKPQQAVAMVDAYLKTKPDRRLEAAALVRKARALLALGKKNEAKAVLDDAIRRLPDTASAAEAVRLRDNL